MQSEVAARIRILRFPPVIGLQKGDATDAALSRLAGATREAACTFAYEPLCCDVTSRIRRSETAATEELTTRPLRSAAG